MANPVVAVTGHRPEKIGGYHFSNPTRIRIRDELRHTLIDLQPSFCISGMALGVDQDFAYVSVELGIPFIAAVPFEGQESRWPQDAQRFYHQLLERAYETVLVLSGEYSAFKMQFRNEWMVDHCDLLIAVWDGSPGGTRNCVKYAERIQRPILHIDPRNLL